MVERYPNNAYAHNFLGACYAKNKLYREAIDSFRQAISINPGYTAGYVNLGVAYAMMGEGHQARKAWEKALEIDPQCKKAEDNLKRLR